MTAKLLFEDTGAQFSQCRQYRYKLWRTWAPGSVINFIMLNPSVANECTNDPTVERCQRRAQRLGYSGVVVTNLFALCATDPKVMLAAEDPVGVDNDAAIVAVAQCSGLVIAAWGNHGGHRGRSTIVREMLRHLGVRLHYLKLAKTGEPMHPLYLPYDLKPVLYDGV